MTLPTAEGLKLDDLGGPFQPGHSMTGLGAQVEPQFFHPTFTVITIKTKSRLLFFSTPTLYQSRSLLCGYKVKILSPLARNLPEGKISMTPSTSCHQPSFLSL